MILNRIINEKSQGIPAWCEQLLRELFLNSYIQVVPLESVDPTDLKYYVDGMKNYLVKKIVSIVSQSNLELFGHLMSLLIGSFSEITSASQF